MNVNYKQKRSGLRVAQVAIALIIPAIAGAQQLQLTPISGGAGAISTVAAAQTGPDQFVTAVRNSTGNLEVIAWYANLNSQQLERQGTYYAEPILPGNTSIAITSPYGLNAGVNGFFETAAINASGNLDLSYWQITPSGVISLVNEYVSDSVTQVAIAAIYSNSSLQYQFMTAARNAFGNLEVSLWNVNSSNQIQLSGTYSAGGVSSISIACLHDLLSDVVTPVVNSVGDLELIQWYYDRFGTAITRGNTYYGATAATQVAAASVPAISIDPTTSLYTAALVPTQAFPQGQLNVAGWNVNEGFASMSAMTIPSTQVSITAANTGAITASVSSPGSEYAVSVFGSNGFGWGEMAAAYGSPATAVSVTPVDTSSNTSTVFAVCFRNSSGNLSIQLWQYVD